MSYSSSLVRGAAFLAVVTSVALITTSVGGCSRKSESAAQVTANEEYQSIERAAFNRRAVELFLPLFWREDANNNGRLEPGELAVLTGHPQGDRHLWIDASDTATPAFTAAFATAYKQMLQTDVPLADPTEQTRHQLVLEELAQGRPILVATDLTSATPAEKNLVSHLLNTARLIERLYARQKGTLGMDANIPATDLASRMLFYRNQSPFCEAPKTEGNTACNALAVRPPRIVGLYPANIQSEQKFCEALAKKPNAAQLMSHFTVVVQDDKSDALRAVPYNEVYRDDMEAVVKELEAAANELGADEAALKNYLLADAGSFRSNDWEPANVAWVAMNAQNSKWYARIGPDEVYYEPCAWKAGFAFQFARINPESIEWQKKLDPLKGDMEKAVAAMAGKPYRARDVKFKIPDFIDVVLNAGDQRNASGATIGESLPNWGPVAEKGGRTVAMTNLFTDADSRNQLAKQMSSLFCKATDAHSTTTPKESLVASVLHEAAHNLGPAHEYKVNGKTDDVLFGGTLAATLEELKAQTASMYLTQWLMAKGIFTNDEAQKIQLRNIAWGFGHISRGMYTADGAPKNYSQLAAMQLGSFIKSGAVAWHAEEMASNGTDSGCLEINFELLPAAIQSFESDVLKIKASGDKASAEKIKAQFVDAKDDFAKVKTVIAERLLRAPKGSLVYSVYW